MGNSLVSRCVEEGCHRPRKVRRRVCACHAQRAWRAAQPVSAQFARLKAKAKRRGIAFTLTHEDWREFCAITGYAGKVGCGRASDVQCDRIEARHGYHRWNIQALSFGLNVEKSARERGRVAVEGPY